MGALDLVETPSITFEEILSDGSTLTNPAADHRRLFLGEDGYLHLRDSAGNITDPVAAGSGIPATIFDAAGDIIYASAADAAARLAAGSAGTVLTSAGVAAPVWAAPPQAGSYLRTAGNYTTASTSFADIDGTNVSFTFTTRARRVLIGQMGSVAVNNVAGEVSFDVAIDGTRQGDAFGIVYMQAAVVGEYMNCSFSYLTDVLSAGSHTFKIMWRVGNAAHTATLLGSAGSGMYARFFATEMA
jgi:hypothetical protein